MEHVPLGVRCIVWPRGGGEVADQFDSELPAEVKPDTLLAHFKGMFGEPIDDAYSDPAGLGHLTIGWVFPVPDFFEIPGPRDDFEVVVIPMLWDPDEAGPTEALFVNLARQRQEFEALRRDGAVDKLVVVDLHQRAPDEPPDVLAREFPAPPAS